LIIVTIPAYNEIKNLEKCVETLIQKTLPLKEEFIVVIAEDGSTDGTDAVAKRLEDEHSKVIWYHSAKKLGRGLALKRVWNKVNGDIYVFVDADLATDMKYYPQLINSIRKGYDLATGSRYIEGAKVNRPFLRGFASKFYNKLIRMMYKDKIFDHQIGFKAFSKRLINDELNNCKSDGWFWDTEIIVRSIHDNYKVVEFPVEWEEKKGKNTPIRRLVSDVMIHGTGLVKLSNTLHKKKSS
jgi:glycosyltransferase involved in cell wall biosynthesis